MNSIQKSSIYSQSRFESKWSSCPERLEYIGSAENRPNQFFKFSLNFDFKKFQKVGESPKSLQKLILLTKELLYRELLFRNNFRQKSKDIHDD